MEVKDVRELAGLMREMGITALEYKDGDSCLKMERAAAVAAGAPAVVAAPVVHAEAPVGVAAAAVLEGFVVKSPMVGVFYKAPGADKPPFVSAGDAVRTGDVLCIIEAMKIMNEITAERDGVIAEVLVENKQVVEFGQPLFRFE